MSISTVTGVSHWKWNGPSICEPSYTLSGSRCTRMVPEVDASPEPDVTQTESLYEKSNYTCYALSESLFPATKYSPCTQQ